MSVDAIGAADDEAVSEDREAGVRDAADGAAVPSAGAKGAAGNDAAEEDDGGESHEGGV